MKVASVYTPIKKIYCAVRNTMRHTAEESSCQMRAGAEALANQNRILVKPANQIEPERVDFKSTKEMFEYAKSKILKPLREEEPYEYTVVMNIRTNKVLAEYKGGAIKCSMSNLESLPLDDKDVVLMHGHPDNFPISQGDMYTLLNYKINQIIAIDKNGQFSMVARRSDVPAAKITSKEYSRFKDEGDANMDDFLGMQNNELMKLMTDYTLRNHADNLGIRYITNYDYLRGAKK